MTTQSGGLRLLLALALAVCACDSDTGGDTPASDATATADTPDSGGTTGLQPDTRDTFVPDPGPDVERCANDAECDDGLWCNGPERCAPDTPEADDFGCAPGEAPQGIDPDPIDCTVLGPCDEDSQSFPEVVLSPGDPCDDGIACTADDVCGSDDTCAGVPDDDRCDDFLFCNGVESCSATLGCMPGVPPMGTDADPGDCLVPGPCEEATQTFTLVPALTGKLCDDGVACTNSDACTAAGTCVGQPDDAACDDGLFCNGPEQCVVGTGCVEADGPPMATDEDPTDCLVPGACDEATDSFPPVPAEAGTACDDDDACTTDDACDAAGTCLAGAPVDCSDDDVCTGEETCDPAAGCQDGTPLPPPADLDPDDCQVVPATCSPTDGWALVPAADGATCTGDPAQPNDQCVAGVCQCVPACAAPCSGDADGCGGQCDGPDCN